MTKTAQLLPPRRAAGWLARAWSMRALPRPVRNTRTMLTDPELKLLFELGRDHFLNTGSVIDAGCFLGGSTLALGHGVLANPRWQAQTRDGIIHSYDRFQVENWMRGLYFTQETPAGDSFEELFRANIGSVSRLVSVHAGDIMAAPWSGGPIEILFIDVAKHWTVNDFVVRSFFPALVPRHSIVVQQDYLYDSWNGWLAVTMEYLREYFEKIGDTGVNSVVFRCTKPIPASVLERPIFASLTQAEIFSLFDGVLAGYEGRQRELLQGSRAHLQRLLQEQSWP